MYEHDITRRKYFEVTCLHIALASAHCLGGHDEVELLAQLILAFVHRGFSEAVEDAPTAPPLLLHVWGWGCWDLLSGLPHYCKVLCVPEWRWSELMSRCWTVAFN